MKIVYLLTLVASLPLTLIVVILCTPFLLLGALATLLMNGAAGWLDYLSDGLQQ